MHMCIITGTCKLFQPDNAMQYLFINCLLCTYSVSGPGNRRNMKGMPCPHKVSLTMHFPFRES